MKRIIPIICCFVLFTICFGVLSAYSVEGLIIDVTAPEYGATANDSTDDTVAFRKAFAMAKTGDPITVKIPAGIYHINDDIGVYSHTTVLAEGATILNDSNKGYLLRGYHVNDDGERICNGENCTHGGYSQCRDVTIDGGVWKRNTDLYDAKSLGDTKIFAFKHSYNIVFKNLTCERASNHFINISSSSDVLFENVTFRDAMECQKWEDPEWKAPEWEEEEGQEQGGQNYRRYFTIEAIHMDICNGEGEFDDFAMPLDATPPKNITVTNCSFENVHCGVGNHHSTDENKRVDNITVENCTFDNVLSYCVFACDFDHLTIQNNTCTSVGSLADIVDCKTVEIHDNTVEVNPDSILVRPIIDLLGGSEAEIKNNLLNNSANPGIRVANKSNALIIQNEISNIETGVKAESNSTINVIDNTISNANRYGIRCEKCSNSEIKNNTVNSINGTGLFADSCPGLVIDNNELVDLDSGIKAYNCTLSITNNIVRNIKNDNYGIRCDGCNDCSILNNTLTSTQGTGIFIISSNNALVSENILSGFSSNGIAVRNLSGAKITKNNVTAKNCGIHVMGTSASPCVCDIIENTLSSSDSYDLLLSEYATCYVNGNVFVNYKFAKAETSSYTGELNLPVLSSVSLSKYDYVYSGKEKKPTVTVKDSVGRTLIEGTHYVKNYYKNINAGTALVRVIGRGIFKSQIIDKEFIINKLSVEPVITLQTNSFVYDGTVKAPSVKVTVNGKVMDASTYKVSYDTGRKYVGTYNVTIKMKGNYSGTATESFSITPKSITPRLSLSVNSYTYNGSARKPSVYVYDGDTKLSTSNYTVKYTQGRINVGKYKVTVVLKGNYRGTATTTFVIKKKAVAPSVTLSEKSFTYNGKVITPVVTVSIGGKTVDPATYTVTYADGRKNAGTYNVTVVLKGNYSGKRTVSFKIKPKPVTPVIELSSTSFVYNGKIQKPKVTVKLGNKICSKSTYEIVYSSGRKNVGTYRVKVTMKGNYSGSAAAYYKITKAVQPVKVAAKTVSVQYNTSKDTVVPVSKMLTITDMRGTPIYTKMSGRGYFTLNKTTGTVTVAKNTPKGTYTLGLMVYVRGNANYASGSSKTVNVTIKIN